VTAVERLSVVGGDALTPDVEAALLPVGCIRSVAFCMAANNALPASITQRPAAEPGR
jgi:hypothetical protein